MEPSSPTLLGLPQELRDMIYDDIFRGIVVPHEIQGAVYREPNEWPNSDDAWGSAYNSLVRTGSKQIRNEVTYRFEHNFLPRLQLHFDNIPSLRKYRRTIQQAGPLFEATPFSLRTLPVALCKDSCSQSRDIATIRLIREYTAYNFTELSYLHAFRAEESEKEGTWQTCGRCDLRLQVVLQGPQKERINIYHVPSSGGMEVVATEKAADRGSRYLELRGRVGGLDVKVLDKMCAAKGGKGKEKKEESAVKLRESARDAEASSGQSEETLPAGLAHRTRRATKARETAEGADMVSGPPEVAPPPAGPARRTRRDGGVSLPPAPSGPEVERLLRGSARKGRDHGMSGWGYS